MLRYLSDHGISSGARLRVTERQPFGGPLLVSFDDGAHEHALGGHLARAMRVQPMRVQLDHALGQLSDGHGEFEGSR